MEGGQRAYTRDRVDQPGTGVMTIQEGRMEVHKEGDYAWGGNSKYKKPTVSTRTSLPMCPLD